MSFNREATITIEEAKKYNEKLKRHFDDMIIHESYLSNDMTEAQKSTFKKNFAKSVIEYNEKIIRFLELNKMRVLSNPEKEAQQKILLVLKNINSI